MMADPAMTADLDQVAREWAALRPAGGFEMIVIDPPWNFRSNSADKPGRNARAHYRCQSLDWIKALPVRDVLAARDAVIWLWTTNPFLRIAFDVLDAWGCPYSTKGEWVKTTKSGGLAFGTGYTFRNCNEPYLISRIGRPKLSRSVRSVVLGQVREHSRKPDEAYAAAEILLPGARRIEVFSRASRPGWTSWGDEIGTFDAPTEAAGVGQ